MYLSIYYAIISSYHSCQLSHTIIWIDAGLSLIRTWGSSYNEIWIITKTILTLNKESKMSSAEWRRVCPGLIVLVGFFNAYKHNVLYFWKLL